MLAGLSLALQQFSSLSLQLRSTKLQRTILTIQFAAEFDQVVYLFFQRLDEVVGHGGYTALRASQHYNARCFIGSMCRRVEQTAFALSGLGSPAAGRLALMTHIHPD